MKKSYMVTVVACVLALCMAASAFAIEPFAMKESKEAPGGASGVPCILNGNTNGSAANYRWYNLCSGYIWLFSGWTNGDEMGVLFGGPTNTAVSGDNDIKRTITYFRNVVPAYNQTVDVFVDVANSGGTPLANIVADYNLDPGMRWNCSTFNASIPCGTDYVVVRGRHDGGAAPTMVTDGPREACNTDQFARSYYYGTNAIGDGLPVAQTLLWIGPLGTPDNWLYWLILDTSDPCVNAVENTSWGSVKGLYR